MTISVALNMLGLCALGTLLLIVSTVAMWRVRGRVALRWSHVVTRLLAVLLAGITLVFYAPQVKALHLRFGTAVPYAAMPMFRLSEVVLAYLPYLLLFGLGALVAEMTFFESCLRRDEDEHGEFAKICSILMTVIVVLMLLICEFGTAVSLLKLHNDLEGSSAAEFRLQPQHEGAGPHVPNIRR